MCTPKYFTLITHTRYLIIIKCYIRRWLGPPKLTVQLRVRINKQLECGPMLNVLVALPNIGGALCSTAQSLADAHY